jgi:hypothetical protein
MVSSIAFVAASVGCIVLIFVSQAEGNSLLLFVMPPHSPSFVLFYSSIFSTDVCYAFPVTFTLTVLFRVIRTLFG